MSYENHFDDDHWQQLHDLHFFDSEDFWSCVIPFVDTATLKKLSMVSKRLHQCIIAEKYTPFYRPIVNILLAVAPRQAVTQQGTSSFKTSTSSTAKNAQRKEDEHCRRVLGDLNLFSLSRSVFSGTSDHQDNRSIVYAEHCFSSSDDYKISQKRTKKPNDCPHEKIAFKIYVDHLNKKDRFVFGQKKSCQQKLERTVDAVIVITDNDRLNMRSLAKRWRPSDFRTFPTPLAIVNMGQSEFVMESEWSFSENAAVFNYYYGLSNERKNKMIENEICSFLRDKCVVLQYKELSFNRSIRTHSQMINDLLNMNHKDFYKFVVTLFGTYYHCHFGSPFWCGFWRAISFYEMDSQTQQKLIRKWVIDFLGHDMSNDCVHLCDSIEMEKLKHGEEYFNRICKHILKVDKKYTPLSVQYKPESQAYEVRYWAIHDIQYHNEIQGYKIVVTIPLRPAPEKIDVKLKFKHVARMNRVKEYISRVVSEFRTRRSTN